MCVYLRQRIITVEKNISMNGDIINSLKNIAGKVLPSGAHVWLYGSRARGDAREDSDWDLLILLDKPSADRNDFDTVAYPFIEAGWEYAANVNPQIYSYSEWERRSISPYFQNVEHDKLLLV